MFAAVRRWILKQLGDDLTEADIDDMIADVDTDGSGWVDFEGKHHDFILHIFNFFSKLLLKKLIFKFLLFLGHF